ncbi:DMT family transporter [Cognatishimia activa]|uniref:Carboxylate/amino acid/amine transporter n=1 Tax=Cognatishimia activa TaxID=1715691 RepID=A0A0P1ITK0_9RHOB|nr:DMT family transporter [Cognatishimia activa]MEE2945670.1 DMT family transporter [Pseudomonadota bacterium]CUI77985.1 carboxylate/amino acid/amine transporter [Cognatishimia activa]CUK26796.1 carboxylate/amino acid/amine transporter [Cognatishimia activa]
MSSIATHQNVTAGLVLIVFTALTISLQDVVFKLFASDMTLWQIFSLRGVFALAILFVIARVRHGSYEAIKAAFHLWPLMRGLCLTCALLCFYAAIPFLSLATMGGAMYLAPIFIALLSAFLIGEPVSRLGWIGVVLGFIGVLVLLQPGSDAFSTFALLPVCAAVLYAFTHIITRARCQGVPLEALSFSLNTMMFLAGCLISLALFTLNPSAEFFQTYPYLFGQWSSVSGSDILVLILLAVFAVCIGMMLAGAYQLAPPATVATFEYSYLVFVAVWDILFFGIPLSTTTLLGMVMIFGAGVLILRKPA